jgi:hypothetical protein
MIFCRTPTGKHWLRRSQRLQIWDLNPNRNDVFTMESGLGLGTTKPAMQCVTKTPSPRGYAQLQRSKSDLSTPSGTLAQNYLTLFDPTSNLVLQYDFPVPLRYRKTSDTVFVAFVCPLSEPVRRFSSCSTDFSQQIAQVVLFLFLHVFLF